MFFFQHCNDFQFSRHGVNMCHIEPVKQFLYGSELNWVDVYKYLGCLITSDLKDDRDTRRQVRAIYCRGNMIIRKFTKCSVDVKNQLFRSYVSCLYCRALWKVNIYNVKYNGISINYYACGLKFLTFIPKRGVTPCRIASTDVKRKRLFSIRLYQFAYLACMLVVWWHAVTCVPCQVRLDQSGGKHKAWNGLGTEKVQKVPTGCVLDMRSIRTSCVQRSVLISSRLL